MADVDERVPGAAPTAPTKIILGRLERAHPREYWTSEAAEFTPWLASEENISLLSEAMGIQLEVQQQEVAVGPFRADILCRDTATGALVLIENQLERTDHTHLGQLFTYAAGLDAVTVVWIAQRFTEEHRAALDWLNRITHEEFRFFGIEVELWRIGASAIAPRLNVVARPNEWSKTVRDNAPGPSAVSSATQQTQAEFWRGVAELLAERGGRLRLNRPNPSSWIGYGMGRRGFSLGAAVHLSTFAKEGSVTVFLYIDEDPQGLIIGQLRLDRDAIEREIGADLEWNAKPNFKNSAVTLLYDLNAPASSRWAELQVWIVEKMEAFDMAFRSRIQSLEFPSSGTNERGEPLV